jgi:hypothetical protein
MCTLTIIPRTDGGWRLAFNRDESRTRPAALPPQRCRFGEREALLPIDPASGGTWLAVNDAGLVLALLNVNPPARPRRRIRRSRGTIIPALLGAGSLAEAGELFERLFVADCQPFLLVVAYESALATWRYDGSTLDQTEIDAIHRPMMFTSSGLGDHLVERPRRALFRDLFGDAADWEQQQDLFHQHSWPESPHLSVCMRRADACTVSHTLVEWDDATAWVTYHPSDPDSAARPALGLLHFATASVS